MKLRPHLPIQRALKIVCLLLTCFCRLRGNTLYLPITPGLLYNEIPIIIILHKVNHQHQHEVDDLFEKACLVGCLLSCVLLLICPLAKHLVHVEVVIAQNGAEGVQEEAWEIFSLAKEKNGKLME